MLLHRYRLDQHRLILPVSVTKPSFQSGAFQSKFQREMYRGLIDTGAQRTVLSKALIAKQSLLRTGHMEFGGLHGTRTHTKYLASIAIWAKRVSDMSSSTDYENAEQTLFSLDSPFEIVDMDNNENFF